MSQPTITKAAALELWDRACGESRTLLGAAVIHGGGEGLSTDTRWCSYNYTDKQARRVATARLLRALAGAIESDPKGGGE